MNRSVPIEPGGSIIIIIILQYQNNFSTLPLYGQQPLWEPSIVADMELSLVGCRSPCRTPWTHPPPPDGTDCKSFPLPPRMLKPPSSYVSYNLQLQLQQPPPPPTPRPPMLNVLGFILKNNFYIYKLHKFFFSFSMSLYLNSWIQFLLQFSIYFHI